MIIIRTTIHWGPGFYLMSKIDSDSNCVSKGRQPLGPQDASGPEPLSYRGPRHTWFLNVSSCTTMAGVVLSTLAPSPSFPTFPCLRGHSSRTPIPCPRVSPRGKLAEAPQKGKPGTRNSLWCCLWEGLAHPGSCLKASLGQHMPQCPPGHVLGTQSPKEKALVLGPL